MKHKPGAEYRCGLRLKMEGQSGELCDETNDCAF